MSKSDKYEEYWRIHMSQTVLVKEGEFGSRSARRGDYDNWINMLERMSRDVHVVETHQEAIGHVSEGKTKNVVYVSLGMLEAAQQIKQEFPQVQVIVVTGGMTDSHQKGVVIVCKGSFNKRKWQKLVNE